MSFLYLKSSFLLTFLIKNTLYTCDLLPFVDFLIYKLIKNSRACGKLNGLRSPFLINLFPILETLKKKKKSTSNCTCSWVVARIKISSIQWVIKMSGEPQVHLSVQQVFHGILWGYVCTLEASCKAYCLPCQVKGNCSHLSSHVGIVKKAFGTAITAYQVPECFWIFLFLLKWWYLGLQQSMGE